MVISSMYYVGGRDTGSVYSCSLSDLLQSCRSESESKEATPIPIHTNMWRKLADLPLHDSTCVSLYGHLLAIGEKYPAYLGSTSSSAVYAYSPTTNSWKELSQMLVARYLCFAVTLPTTNELMVVGGKVGQSNIASVEFANLIIVRPLLIY